MNSIPKLKIFFVLGLILLIVWGSLTYPQQVLAHLQQCKLLTEQHPTISALVFIGVYVTATILVFLPVSFLTLIGGWLFGIALGSLYNIIGALIGAAIAFLVSRHLANHWVSQHIGGKTKIIRDGVTRAGWRFVALVRLAPVLPFNVLNCALGLSEIPFRDYLLATAIFMLPAKIIYTYVGSLGFTFIVNPQQSEIIKIFIALAGLIVVISIPLLFRYLKKSTD